MKQNKKNEKNKNKNTKQKIANKKPTKNNINK